MKILLLSQYFYPETFRVNDLALALRERGHDVTVLTAQPNYPSGRFADGYGWFKCWREEFHGIPVLRVPIVARAGGGGIRLAFNYLSFVLFATIFGLPRLARRYDACIVFETSPITACLPAIFYKWISKTPVHLWVQDLWPESVSAVGMLKNPFVLRRIGSLVGWIYRRCDKIWIQSEAFRKSVLKWGGQPEQIVYVPNWAEDFYAKKPQLDPSLLPTALAEKFTILFAGNLGKAQSLQTILDAAQSIKSNSSIHWLILGSGSEGAWFEQQVEKMGLSTHVTFLGRKPPTDMPQYFHSANVLLVTLKQDPIFSLVIPSKVQSYLASGRPIVGALDGEGQRVIKESESGLAGPAEDSQQLAENIKKLAQMSEQQIRNLGENGQRYYQTHFNRQAIISSIESIIN